MAESLLAPEILRFFRSKGNQTEGNCYFCSDGTFDFPAIVHLIVGGDVHNETEARDVFPQLEYEDFLRIYERLQPIYVASKCGLIELPPEALQLQWLGSNYKHIELPGLEERNENNQSSTSVVENVLLLTALLEFALGNVYYSATEGRASPPHLLRDLLNTQELYDVFGYETLLFLRFLMGTPKSINLRNIVWHGFPAPEELPRYYVSVLLLTIHSLGVRLRGGMNTAQGHFHLEERQQLKDFSRFLYKIEVDVMPLDRLVDKVLQQQQQFLNKCKWLTDRPHKFYWRHLFKYYNQIREREQLQQQQQPQHNHSGCSSSSGSYCCCCCCWKFVILILPQIELLLRLIYGHANGWDIRAKLAEYYITMDTVFENDIPTALTTPPQALLSPPVPANKLLQFELGGIGEGVMAYMYDLFAAPHGPRLRDKVSHGEVTISAIDNPTLCRLLMYLTCNLLQTPRTAATTVVCVDGAGPLAGYESSFHLNAQCGVALQVAGVQLRDFMRDQLAQATCTWCRAPTRKIRIFNRPRREAQLVTVLLRISQRIMQTCCNYRESIAERSRLWQQHELHSKRRRTLEKLVAVLPQVGQALADILQCAQDIFAQLQCDHEQNYTEDTLRFLKRTLTITENFAKYSSKESNEWVKSVELCGKFKELQRRLCSARAEQS